MRRDITKGCRACVHPHNCICIYDFVAICLKQLKNEKYEEKVWWGHFGHFCVQYNLILNLGTPSTLGLA